MVDPKLRTVEKVKAPYALGRFPNTFAFELGREVAYLIATRENPRLEGSDWEEIFAKLIKAEWKPSNIGLDDVVLGQCAWGAKSVKHSHPSEAKTVRLISGRNSPVFSYGDTEVTHREPNELGGKILGIWNERVSSVRERYKHVRTVVLVKSNDLLGLAVFELETLRYSPEDFKWKWNKHSNLEGFDKEGHKFTWQPHGSQFTIVESVPSDRLAIRLTDPSKLDRESVLRAIKFNNSWISILK